MTKLRLKLYVTSLILMSYSSRDLWDAISRVVRALLTMFCFSTLHSFLTPASSRFADCWTYQTLDPGDDEESGEGDAYGYGDDNGDADVSYIRRESYGERDAALKRSRQQMLASQTNIQINDHLLFGPPRANIDISTLHPKQAQFFRLWQIYLDNVNPLLRVTHTPTLQPRIIDAASNVDNIGPELEALIFSIYCVSVMSITEEECQNLFASSQKNLLELYQFACQQALFKCGAWHTGEVDGLTATYLYLVLSNGLFQPIIRFFEY